MHYAGTFLNVNTFRGYHETKKGNAQFEKKIIIIKKE